MSSPNIPNLLPREFSEIPYDQFFNWVKQYQLDRFVLVNIASNELYCFEKEENVLQMKVIVGTKKNKTPLIATYADAAMIYPYWTPTANIIFKEIIPTVIKDPGYLERNNFEVLDSKYRVVDPSTLNWSSFSRKNFPYKIRQGTGCDNSLGLLKINIQNPFSIYMHDTPHTAYSKGLFNREKRFFSHGCIRLEKALEFAQWLKPSKTIDEQLMDKCLVAKKPEVISLQEKVPVFILYFTKFRNSLGEIKEVEDYYGLEK